MAFFQRARLGILAHFVVAWLLLDGLKNAIFSSFKFNDYKSYKGYNVNKK